MATQLPNPRVGVAAIIRNPQGRIIVGKRKSSHGAGSWALPGGHLEYGESLTACAEREVMEETGLRVRGTGVVAITNDVFGDVNKHYITLFIPCDLLRPTDEPRLLEPNKCEGWFWKSWPEIKVLPDEELFVPIVNLLRAHPDIEDLITRAVSL